MFPMLVYSFPMQQARTLVRDQCTVMNQKPNEMQSPDAEIVTNARDRSDEHFRRVRIRLFRISCWIYIFIATGKAHQVPSPVPTIV